MDRSNPGTAVALSTDRHATRDPRARASWPLMLYDAVRAWFDDSAPRMGAAIAYYATFSLAPVLVIAMALAGALMGRDAARKYVFRELADLVGAGGARTIESLMSRVAWSGSNVLAASTGVVVLIVGATTVFVEIRADLDHIWRVPPDERAGAWQTVRGRATALALVLCVGFVILGSLVLSTVVATLGSWWHGSAQAALLVRVADALVGLGAITALFALIYKVLPSTHVHWRDVVVGALVTALLFTIGKLAVGTYLAHSAIATTYGAAGSFVVLMAWIYYSAQIFLLGAEFTHIYAERCGSRCNGGSASSPAVRTPSTLASENDA